MELTTFRDGGSPLCYSNIRRNTASRLYIRSGAKRGRRTDFSRRGNVN
ncbi:uncharacterized protein HMPREF1541_09053 [Cyphellophora europaea CBS 101466]|uniref:Uncharacterized protein n=1 Tax=Cyphellophora europaea (strain CBS 101466) TaxID=1220924 RepID=W2RKA6_CYPE1|nr:uncharacterized protein HMPREF1541_09053 [Cyphellophora europaea CBS 101466]ETN36775.1 hypothetical protein HMPREF1541_09053 [Cyphellophora europaea CBS 101466]